MSASPPDDAASGAASISVAASEAAFRSLWSEHVGNEQLPDVDFTVESVVVLQLGQRNTGGYAIELQDVSERDGRLRVVAPVSSPGRDSIVTMAFTSPYAIVAVRSRDFNEAEWVGSDGSPLAREASRNRM